MAKKVFFDADLCVGCYACMVACEDQNDIELFDGQLPWRWVSCVATGTHPDVSVGFRSLSCMHCDDAPCIVACPAVALVRDGESGSVIVRAERCIGCHSCAMACPFGAPRFTPHGKMEKCDGCHARTRFGYKPACVEVCPAGALTFADVNEEMQRRGKRASARLQ